MFWRQQLLLNTHEPESTQIFVNTLMGNTLTLDVLGSTTINMIKAMIYMRLSIPPEEQHLSRGGRRLEMGRTLDDYDIRGEDSVTCAVYQFGS